MIYLEPTVEQIINEEGQLILSLSDLGITWEKLEKVFIGTYEQSKGYMTIYDWETKTMGQTLSEYPDITNIRHITYTTGYLQRYMPDMPGNFWEYNPYTKQAASLMNTNFSLEVAKYPTCSQLEHCISLNNIKKGVKYAFALPFTPSSLSINTSEGEPINVQFKEINFDTVEDYHNKYLEVPHHGCLCCNESITSEIQITGDVTGSYDNGTYTGYITFKKDYDTASLNFLSKYVGIKELDLTCELFYNWFKGNMLTMIGSVKKQIDMSGSGLPFDMNQDGLLERGRELMQKVEELKSTKSHWSNF